MDTLENQSPRKLYNVDSRDIVNFLEKVKEMAEDLMLPVESVLEAYRIKELVRRNDLYIANSDAFDGQMSGLSEMIKELSYAIRDLKEEN